MLHRQESLPSSAPEVGIRLGPGRRRAFRDQFSLALHLNRPGASTPSRYPFVRKQKQLSLIPVIHSRKVRSSDSHLMMADTPTEVQLPPAPPLGTTVPPKPCPKPASGRPGVLLHPCSGPRPANAAPVPRCPQCVLSGVGFSYLEVSSQPDPSSACLLSPAVARHLRWGPQGTLHPTTAHLPVSMEETQQAGQWAGQWAGQGGGQGAGQTVLPPVPHPPLRGTPLVTAGIAWGAPQKFQSGERSRERTRQGWEGAQRTPHCPRSVRKHLYLSSEAGARCTVPSCGSGKGKRCGRAPRHAVPPLSHAPPGRGRSLMRPPPHPGPGTKT